MYFSKKKKNRCGKTLFWVAIGVIYESLLCREEIAAQSEMDFKSIFGHYGYWSDSKSHTLKNHIQIQLFNIHQFKS